MTDTRAHRFRLSAGSLRGRGVLESVWLGFVGFLAVLALVALVAAPSFYQRQVRGIG